MAYAEVGELAHGKSSGVVVPMVDGRGNPYPEGLRTQQVGLGVVRAVAERIDAALAPRVVKGKGLCPKKLATVHLGESLRAHVRSYLLASLFPELYGDPVPAKVRAVRRVVSPKALSLLNRRMSAAFNPPGGVLSLPGVRLTGDDLFDLLTLVHDHLFADDAFAAGVEITAPVPPPPSPPPSPPPPPSRPLPTPVANSLPSVELPPPISRVVKKKSAAVSRGPSLFDDPY
jgi:hypothetical protein